MGYLEYTASSQQIAVRQAVVSGNNCTELRKLYSAGKKAFVINNDNATTAKQQ